MLWPALNCIACGEGVFARGIRSPSQKFTAHFSHRHEAGESCPLSSKTTRFRLLSRVPSDPGLAQRVRSAFYTFEKLRDAYLICRHLRGGEGMLKQEAFLKMVQVADSYGIWGYSYMPAWGIPLLLMLMDNHRTRKDTAYFYSLVKPRSHFSETWWHNNIILQAHWADTGNVIGPTVRGLNAGFRHQIVFPKQQERTFLRPVNMTGPQGKNRFSWTDYAGKIPERDQD
jgi:hypothetical protein